MLPLLNVDFYKSSHHLLYPKGLEYLYSNTTPRASRLKNVDKIVVFGLQYLLKEYFIDQWNKHFFEKSLEEVLSEYHRVIDNTLGPNIISDENIKYLHSLGYLPIKIKALPEGSLCPLRVPFMTITNTDPKCAWLTNFLETIVQTVIWHPSTCATIAHQYRKLLDKFAVETSDNTDSVQWQAHDFSMRGCSSVESAGANGAGHLLSFTGTDTIPAIMFLEKYYGGNVEQELIGASVVASEHSVECSHYNGTDEYNYIQACLDVQNDGITSIVADGYNYFNFITKELLPFKEQIIQRNGKIVVRPDCYDSETQILTNSGWKYFYHLTNSDLVAQVLDDGSREFVKPSNIITQQYEGDMYHFKDHHGKVDLLVTPNHRMVLQKDNEEQIIEAEKLGNRGHWYQKMIRTASAPSNPDNCLSYIDRLRIAFQADGSFQTGCNSNKIRFSFSKARKINRLTEILDTLNISYAIYDLSDNRFEFNITLDQYDFSKDFDWVDEKSLTKEWCQEFIEECSYWDSCRRSDKRFKFDTTVSDVADKVEFIALSAGYGVLKSVYVDDRQDHFSNVFTLHILKDNTVGGQSWKKEKIQYNGTVHCVTVPTGKILVKRNRCTMISGNSGNPIKIICGYVCKKWEKSTEVTLEQMNHRSTHELMFDDNDAVQTSDGDYLDIHGNFLTEHEVKGSIQLLWELFGGSVNSKGYKELDPHIGLIYGDSITFDRCQSICQELKDKGFASNNVVFGIGSFTYTYNTRDTFSLACKATWVQINGQPKDIYKDPQTGNGVKKSAKGLLRVDRINGELSLKDQCTREEEEGGELVTVFENGKLLVEHSLSEIRERLNNG